MSGRDQLARLLAKLMARRWVREHGLAASEVLTDAAYQLKVKQTTRAVDVCSKKSRKWRKLVCYIGDTWWTEIVDRTAAKHLRLQLVQQGLTIEKDYK